MKETNKKSAYSTFSFEPIKAENPPKNTPKSTSTRGSDLRVKGAK